MAAVCRRRSRNVARWLAVHLYAPRGAARRQAPVPRGRVARLAGARRAADSRPGEGGLRARPRGGHRRPALASHALARAFARPSACAAETNIGSGQVSVPSVAVDLARRSSATCVGTKRAAGRAPVRWPRPSRALLPARGATHHGGRPHPEKVEALARVGRRRGPAVVRPAATLAEADVVITSTSARASSSSYEAVRRRSQVAPGRSSILHRPRRAARRRPARRKAATACTCTTSTTSRRSSQENAVRRARARRSAARRSSTRRPQTTSAGLRTRGPTPTIVALRQRVPAWFRRARANLRGKFGT